MTRQHFQEYYGLQASKLICSLEFTVNRRKIHLIFSIFVPLVVSYLVVRYVLVNFELEINFFIRIMFLLFAIGLVMWFLATIFRNGKSVIGVNKEGLCYKALGFRARYIFINWACIKEISFYTNDGVRNIKVDTSVSSTEKIPPPANCFLRIRNDTYQLFFLHDKIKAGSELLEKIEKLRS